MQTIGLSKSHFRPTRSLHVGQPYTLRAHSIYTSRNRTLEVTASVVQKFPPLPDDPLDVVRLGLSRRPTFFGCDPKQNPAEYPLMIYVPNAPPADGSDPVTK
jgi:lysophospholipase